MKKNILFLLLISIIFISITGCGNNDSKTGSNTSTGTNPYSDGGDNNGSSQKQSSKNLGENIISSGAVTAKGKLVVFVTNNNSVAVDMEIEVEFYDKDGKIVGSDSEDLMAVGSKAEVAVDMWSTPDSFDNYKIYVDVKESTTYSYFGKVELVHNNNGKKIVAQVKNNSNDDIEYISVSVVYYKNDVVVGYDDGLESDIKPGRSANFTLYYPTNKKYDDIKFDKYKVFINEAYSYNW